MSHEIDTSNGRANIAFVGETPWHRLGAKMKPGQSIDDWRRAAGLDWKVMEAKPWYEVPGRSALESFDGRKVLFRSDTKAPLSVMGERFNVVQPADVLDLYSEIARAGGFELETAGCLSGGKRIWALAKVGEGADVIAKDRVRPYVLLATSFDGSMATLAKFTAVRVVCHNTITMAINKTDEHEVRVTHATRWTEEVAKKVRKELGVVHGAWDRFMTEAQTLAAKPMATKEADEFVASLLEPWYGGENSKGEQRNVRDTKAYRRIMELFSSESIGNDVAGATRWGMLNAVTQLVDHERGRSDASRLESAWFGSGEDMKDRAFRILNGEFARVAEPVAA